MRRLALVCALMYAACFPASAEVICNEHGAIVTIPQGKTFYLGKNCDAAQKGGGSGFWFNSASFLAVFIDGEAYQVTEEVDCLPFCASQL